MGENCSTSGRLTEAFRILTLLKAVKNYPAFYGKITGGSDLIGIRPYFNSLDQAGQANFINGFKNASDANLLKLTENGGDLFKIWKANQNVYEVSLLQAIKTYPAFYGKITGGSDLIGIRPYFNSLDQAGQANFINRFQNAPDANLLKLTENSGELFNVWKVNQEIANVDLVRAVKNNRAFYAGIKSELSDLRLKFNALDDAEKIQFLDDFGSAGNKWSVLNDNSNFVSAWKKLRNAGVDDVIRKDVNWLKNIDIWDSNGLSVTANATERKVVLFDGGGIEIGHVTNDGKLIPKKYDYDPVTQRPRPLGTAVGDLKNGYQVHQHGSDFSIRRVADRGPYTTAELNELYYHSKAHILERHGPDVPDEALNKRATGAIAPDGQISTTSAGAPNPPPHSSKFESSQRLKDALQETGPTGSVYSPPATGSAYPVEYPPGGALASTPYGYGIPRGGGPPVPMYRVKAFYVKEGGVWKLLTMYPIP